MLFRWGQFVDLRTNPISGVAIVENFEESFKGPVVVISGDVHHLDRQFAGGVYVIPSVILDLIAFKLERFCGMFQLCLCQLVQIHIHLAFQTASQIRCNSSACGEYATVPLGSLRLSMYLTSHLGKIAGGLMSLPVLIPRYGTLCSGRLFGCWGRHFMNLRGLLASNFLDQFLDLFRGRFWGAIFEGFRDLFDVTFAEIVTGVCAIRETVKRAEDATELFSRNIEVCGYFFRGCHVSSPDLNFRLGRNDMLFMSCHVGIISYRSYMSMANKKKFYSVFSLFFRFLRVNPDPPEYFSKGLD